MKEKGLCGKREEKRGQESPKKSHSHLLKTLQENNRRVHEVKKPI